MSFVPTTNYALQKPDVNTEVDDWGDDINTNFDLIDTRMKLNEDAAAGALAAAALKAPLVHSHIASDITTGILAPALMPAYSGDVTSLEGTTVNVLITGAVTTAKIADGQVTNPKLANMATATMKGSLLGGVPADLTVAEVNNLLGVGGGPFAPLVHQHNAADINAGNLAIARLPVSAQKFCIVFKFDGGGSVIAANSRDEIFVPFAGTITQWTIVADQSGSIIFNLWGVAYSSYPPTVANAITGSAKPSTSGSTKAQSSTLTGWNVVVAADQTYKCNVDSCSGITRATLILEVTKTV